MPIQRSEVLRIAKLARLRIDEEEAGLLACDLERIVAYIDTLKDVELPADAEALSYFDSDVHREDRAVGGLERDEALQNAPETDGRFFLVPRIVDKQGDS
jgi:aspartyl-tRNA(Asn)/glutamyl-tRNA(Gln) amidotransferase subunit C